MESSVPQHTALVLSRLRAVGVLTLCWSAVGCTGGGADPAMTPAAESQAPMAGSQARTDFDSDAAELATIYGPEVAEAVKDIRAATAPFRDLEEAVAAGYSRDGGRCMDNLPEGAMGYHHTNHDLLDDTLELERPEILTFQRTAGGDYELTGVEYVVPKDRWSAPEPPSIMGQELRSSTGLGLWYLHVWVWEPNPNGLFANWNPNVRCPE